MPNIIIRNSATDRKDFTLEPAKNARILDRSTLCSDALRTVDFDLFRRTCTCEFANGKKGSFSLEERDVRDLSKIGTADRSQAIDAMARIVYPRLKGEDLQDSFHSSLAHVATQNKARIAQHPMNVPNLLESKRTELAPVNAKLERMHSSDIKKYDAFVKSHAAALDPYNSTRSFQDLKSFFHNVATVDDAIGKLNTQANESSETRKAFERLCTTTPDTALRFKQLRKISDRILVQTRELKSLMKSPSPQAPSLIQKKESLIEALKKEREKTLTTLRTNMSPLRVEGEAHPLDAMHKSLKSSANNNTRERLVFQAGREKKRELGSYLDGYVQSTESYEREALKMFDLLSRKEELSTFEFDMKGLYNEKAFSNYKSTCTEAFALKKEIDTLGNELEVRHDRLEQERGEFIDQLQQGQILPLKDGIATG